MVLANFNAALCFLTVDVDELSEFSSSWDITPTFFFLENGEQVDKLVGRNRTELEKKVIHFQIWRLQSLADHQMS
ncbi:thioredoxin H4-1-like [Aristolochia californica]|uniref:thioredoxin H4-1-like n=1 Tax=Aristolochia californica TaxID=171875 RepID=UPI0035DA6500